MMAMDKFYDTIGIIGIVATNMFSWVDKFETTVKVIGIAGGVILMVLSIVHKWAQIKNEREKSMMERIHKLKEAKESGPEENEEEKKQ